MTKKAQLELGLVTEERIADVQNPTETGSPKSMRIPEGFTLVKAADPRNGWYSVAPHGAGLLLISQPAQRYLNEAKAARKFAPQMKSGEWRPTGQPVILDEQMQLLDGQGRMRACQIAGVPFVTYVVFDSKRAYFPMLDLVEPRSAANTLQLLQVKNTALLASICKLAVTVDVLKLAPASQSSSPVSNNQVLDYYQRHKQELLDIFEDVAETAPDWRRAVTGIIAPSVLLFVYYLGKRISPEKAFSFLTGVVTGANLSKTSPALQLRNIHQGKVARYSVNIQLALAIKAMNLMLLGREVKCLRWSSSTEEFPRLVSINGERE